MHPLQNMHHKTFRSRARPLVGVWLLVVTIVEVIREKNSPQPCINCACRKLVFHIASDDAPFLRFLLRKGLPPPDEAGQWT